MTVSLAEGTNATWGTEYSLPANSTTLTPQTADVYLTVRVDFSALIAGDTYDVKIYEKVNAGSSTLLDVWTVTGIQVEQFQSPLLLVGGGWDVTVTRTGGSDRSVRWTLETETSSITLTDDAATIGSTEYSLPGDTATPTPQTSDVYLQPWLSLANLATGDRFRIRVYEKMNSGTSRVILDRSVDHTYARLWTCPILLVGGGWDVTLAKVSGTDRSIAWSLRTDPRTGSVSEPEYPQLANATTAESIRDRIIELILALTPSVLSGDRFREYRNEREGNFITACESAPAGCLRRYQVRTTGDDEPPEVSDTTTAQLRTAFTILVAYPNTHRYGGGRDRDDVIDEDWKAINYRCGIYGRANFSSTHDCTPLGCTKSFEPGEAVSYLVIEMRLLYAVDVDG